MLDAKSKAAKFNAVRKAIKNLEKSTKKENLVQIYGEADPIRYECIPTGFLTLDAACTGAGVPRSRIIEIFGRESSGKSLICQKIVASCQNEGGVAAYVDMECSFDPVFAEKLGVNVDELIISQPGHLQEAFAVVDALIDAGVDVIVMDSIAALVPKEELEAEVGKQTIGLVARYMSQFMKRVTKKIADSKSILLCVNQVRDKIGVLYGDPTTTPGGAALKFYSSLRLRVSRKEYLKVKTPDGNEEYTGASIRVTVVKNKTAPPYKTAEFIVYFDGRKADICDEIAQIALNKGLIPRYNSSGELVPNGRIYKWPSVPEFIVKKKDDIVPTLRKFPQVVKELEEIIRSGKIKEHIINYDIDDEIETDDFDSIIDEPDEPQTEEEMLASEGISEAEEGPELDWSV